MDRKRNTRVGIWAVAPLIILLIVAVSLSGCTPQNVNVNIFAPLQVTKGEEFVFEIHVQNTSEQSQLLYSIDVPDDYLDGIAIKKTEPPFVQSFHIPIVNALSYEFKQNISPQSNLVVKFFAVALMEKSFRPK